MLRRLLLVGTLLAALVGCQDDMPPPTAQAGGDPWSAVPRNDEERWELLALARDVDACDLLPPEAGIVLRSGRVALDACRFVLRSPTDTADPAEFELILSAFVGPPGQLPEQEEALVREEDGVTIVELADTASSPGIPVEQLTERNCTLSAWFPSSAALMAMATTPVGTDPCERGNAILTGALARFRAEPVGTPPERDVPTVLDGADPCRVLSVLGVTAPADDQRAHRCLFGYRGDEIEVDYGFENQDWALRGIPRYEVRGRAVHHDEDPDDEFVFACALVGSAIDPAAEPGLLGPKRPAVTVTGRDAAVVDEVMRAVLELLPPA